MADSDVILNPGAGGAAIDCEKLGGAGPGGVDLYRQRIQLAGKLIAEIAAIINTAPGAGDYGLVTRNIPSGVQPVSISTLPLPTGGATEATLLLVAKDATLSAGIASLLAALAPISTESTSLAIQSTLAAIRDTAGIKKITDPLPVGANTIGKVDQGAPGLSPWLADITDRVARVLGHVIVDSSALPAGAATQATLVTLLADATFTARINTLGQKLMAASTPVVIASDQSPIPISGSVSATNPSVGVNTAASPASSTQIGGKDGAGNLQAAEVRTSAPVGTEEALVVRNIPSGTQPVSVTSLPLPAGAATETTLSTRATEATLLTLLSQTSAILAQLDAALSTRASEVTLASRLSTASFNARINTLGQKTMAGSTPVVLASDQSPVPVTGSIMVINDSVGPNGASIPTSSTLIGGRDASGNLQPPAVLPTAPVGTEEAMVTRNIPSGTQAVSAASLPLPAGAATEVTLATRVADATITARLNTLGQKTMAASAPVVIASDQASIPVSVANVALEVGGHLASIDGKIPASPAQEHATAASPSAARLSDGAAFYKATTPADTQPISAAALPLPTGAATEATLTTLAKDATLTARFSTLGQKIMASSAPVVIASDQSAIPISAAALPLPAGAATEATLATRVADATITARLNTLGQKTMAASAPVVIASDQSPVPVTGSVTATNPSIGLVGAMAPTSASQIAGNDGSGFLQVPNVQTTTPAGTEEGLVTRNIPSGTQAISAAALPLPAGAATEATLATRSSEATLATRASEATLATRASEATLATRAAAAQLPAALVGGRLDANLGAWLGSTTPTVGQKTSAASIPVVIASDQDVNVDVGVADKTTFTYGTSNQQPVGGVFQDTSPTLTAGQSGAVRMTSQRAMHQNLRDAAGAELATAGNPLRTDPTGTTTQPISAASLPLPSGAATEATLATRAADRTTAAAPFATRLSDGAAFYKATTPADTQPISAAALPLPAGASTETTLATRLADATFTGRINTLGQKTMAASTPVVIASDQSAIPVTGPLTDTQLRASAVPISAASLPLPTGAATEATLATLSTSANQTNGTQKAIARGGAKGATVAADLTSTAEGADHQALDVQLYGSAGNAVAVTAANALKVDGSAVTQPISAASLPLPTGASQEHTTAASPNSTRLSDGAAFYDAAKTGQLPAALVGGRLDENVGAWLGSTAPTVGQKAAASSLPVVIASDQSAVPVSTPTSTTGATSTVASSASSVQLLASNASRRGATIYNDSTKILYVKLGTTASATDFTTELAKDDYYEVPFGYTGRIDGIWAAVNGNARLTELT